MKRFLYSMLIVVAISHLASALRSGRYDPQILTETSKILQNAQSKNIHADVEDGIVTLTGTVELESVRSGLEYRIRHVRHVAGVRNEVLLAPPPLDDKILFGRLAGSLRDAGFDYVRVKVHNGAVTLIGVVRTQRDRIFIIRTVWATDGVREVFPQLSVAD